ncbi:MAG TPA: cell division protein FtsL [Neisseriales bacterium]|nr:cell division protein FtsL [Neisseriales bacterium]
MLRAVNLILVISILVNAIYIVNQRFTARQHYMQLASLQNKASVLNKEYTRLQLEEGTYSSGLAVQDFATTSLGLVQPDKLHIVELK